MPVRARPWLAALIGLVTLPILAQTDKLDRAIGLYDAAEYRQAAELLEQEVAEAPTSEAYHWLGKSYGHMAERSGPFRALELARLTRRALEKAVELDAHNRAAAEDLLEFYQQAPAIVGGSHERATKLEKRLTVMDSNTRSGPDDQATPESGS